MQSTFKYGIIQNHQSQMKTHGSIRGLWNFHPAEHLTDSWQCISTLFAKGCIHVTSFHFTSVTCRAAMHIAIRQISRYITGKFRLVLTGRLLHLYMDCLNYTWPTVSLYNYWQFPLENVQQKASKIFILKDTNIYSLLSMQKKIV